MAFDPISVGVLCICFKIRAKHLTFLDQSTCDQPERECKEELGSIWERKTFEPKV